MKVEEIAYHRNGVNGAPFHAVLFRDKSDEGTEELFLGIVFEEDAHCAVINVDRIPKDGVGFAKNSFRGDNFEQDLRAHVALWAQP